MSQGLMRGMAVLALCGLSATLPAMAEEPGKALPTLLIKGDIVSLDQNDPAAPLLKVKDRYGFETPIYLTPETKVTQGEQPAGADALSTGAAVEVEYNFDINTAKRHAVSVKLGDAASSVSSMPMTPPVGELAIPAPEMNEPEMNEPEMNEPESMPEMPEMPMDEPMPADEAPPVEAVE